MIRDMVIMRGIASRLLDWRFDFWDEGDFDELWVPRGLGGCYRVDVCRCKATCLILLGWDLGW